MGAAKKREAEKELAALTQAMGVMKAKHKQSDRGGHGFTQITQKIAIPLEP